MIEDLERILDQALPIRVYDKIIPEEKVNALHDLIMNGTFKYGWHSNSQVEFGHWNTFFAGKSKKNRIAVDNLLSGEVKDVADFIKSTTMPPESRILRCYSNAYTFGAEGYPHTDSHIDSDMTAVLYLNKEWKPEWAGETVFFDEEDEILQAVLPKYNRLVVFPSAMLHVARSVSRICNHLRVVFVLKVAIE